MLSLYRKEYLVLGKEIISRIVVLGKEIINRIIVLVLLVLVLVLVLALPLYSKFILTLYLFLY